MAVICAGCGEKQGIFATLTADLGGAPYYCDGCMRERQQEEGKRLVESVERRKRTLRESRSVIVSSTPTLDGFWVKQYLGIESVEFVIGTGVFSEVSSSIADFFGQRSSAFEKKLREAKEHAMAALKFAAAEKGANAVLAVDLDYVEFSNNRVALILNGTLAVVESATA